MENMSHYVKISLLSIKRCDKERVINFINSCLHSDISSPFLELPGI